MAENTEVVAAETTGTAVANPTNWADRLAKYAVAAVAEEAAPTGSFISARAGMLMWQGKPVAGNALDVVVIDTRYENAYYPNDFDPDVPASPVCFAFGHDEATLAPHPDSEKPQHDQCKGCPQNEFGTAERGKGKACKNIRRLAMLPGDDLSAEGLAVAEVAFMKLPVTSTKNWATHVHTLGAIDKIPPFAAVTTVGVKPDPKTQFQVTFTKKALIRDGDVLDTLLSRHEGQGAIPIPPYQANSTPVDPKTKKSNSKF